MYPYCCFLWNHVLSNTKLFHQSWRFSIYLGSSYGYKCKFDSTKIWIQRKFELIEKLNSPKSWIHRKKLNSSKIDLNSRAQYSSHWFSSRLCLLLWSLYGLWRSGLWFNAKYQIQFIHFPHFILLNLLSHKSLQRYCRFAMRL